MAEKKPETFKHQCIKPKCNERYTDTDPDPYYCKKCKVARQEAIKKVDKKFAGRSTKHVKSTVQILNEGGEVTEFGGAGKLFSRKVK